VLVALAANGCAAHAQNLPPPVNVARPQAPEPTGITPAALTVPAVTARSEQGTVTARTLALVNNNPILESEVREAAFQRLGEVLSKPEAQRGEIMKTIFQSELQRLVERELILQDMKAKLEKQRPTVLQEMLTAATKEYERRMRDLKKERGIRNDAELKEVLSAQGLSLAGIRRQLERNFMMMQYVRGRVQPVVERITLSEIRDFYRDNQAEFNLDDRVKWQDIFIDASKYANPLEARRMADYVVARAQAGDDFLQLAKQYDAGDSTFRNGFGFGESRGQLRPAVVEPTVFALRKGEVGPLIEMPGGFHIVKVTERQYAGIKEFDEETQSEIRRKLSALVADREYKRIIAELREKSVIQMMATTAQ
jgi:foldase protein PrsA